MVELLIGFAYLFVAFFVLPALTVYVLHVLGRHGFRNDGRSSDRYSSQAGHGSSGFGDDSGAGDHGCDSGSGGEGGDCD
jgi:hypothetical protein